MERRPKTLARIALAAYALLAVVPGAGLVICLDAGGGTHVGVGMHGDCPCPTDPDGHHPPCVDVHVDGVRDQLPPDVPAPDLQPAAWLALAAAVPQRTMTLAEVAGRWPRAGPPPDAGPPGLRRALDARAAVVLLI